MMALISCSDKNTRPLNNTAAVDSTRVVGRYLASENVIQFSWVGVRLVTYKITRKEGLTSPIYLIFNLFFRLQVFTLKLG
ncbi:MAG: hypothetical protein ACI9Y1_001647 [Lentisphaeria bacterium]|jgi:hypothetical protein